MGFEDSIVAIYKADTGVGGVNTLLSGGIYTFAYIDRLGINYDNTPAVFASGGLYKYSKCSCAIRIDSGVMNLML